MDYKWSHNPPIYQGNVIPDWYRTHTVQEFNLQGSWIIGTCHKIRLKILQTFLLRHWEEGVCSSAEVKHFPELCFFGLKGLFSVLISGNALEKVLKKWAFSLCNLMQNLLKGINREILRDNSEFIL